MIRFVNLYDMPSGRFSIAIFGIDYFPNTRLLAITLFNLRLLIGKVKNS